MLHPSATTKLKVAPQYVPSFYNARAKRSDGQSPPLPVSGGGRQLDISFRPLLSEEELKAIWEKGRVLFESGRAEEACAYCEDILLSHPGDTALKFRIASLYMRYMAALKDEAFVQKQLERSIRLFEDSTHSTDTETREAAFYTLSGLYMMNGEAGRALDAVEKLPQPDYDARMLKASILRQTGQAEEAEKLHQTCLWGYVRDAG